MVIVVGEPLAQELAPLKATPRLHLLKKETFELAGRVMVNENEVIAREPVALFTQKSFETPLEMELLHIAWVLV
jgi:hypothetical protein